jgi:opacity protein-like surface antigen
MKKILDLLAATTTLATPAMAQDWSAEVFGGARRSGDLNFEGFPFQTDSGTFYGARVLRHNLVKNFAFGLEVNTSEAVFSGFNTDIDSTAVMAIARYSLPIESRVDFYTTVGLGYVDVDYDTRGTFSGSGSDSGFGAQITFGANFKFSERAGVLVEVTHQDTLFDPVIDNRDIEFNSTNITFGLSYDF